MCLSIIHLKEIGKLRCSLLITSQLTGPTILLSIKYTWRSSMILNQEQKQLATCSITPDICKTDIKRTCNTKKNALMPCMNVEGPICMHTCTQIRSSCVQEYILQYDSVRCLSNSTNLKAHQDLHCPHMAQRPILVLHI